ncbi:hypothetical protein PIIN_04209 [Serendipita indica DSM 11827]|uniref:Uncharacterized protein n=1 Tax=Serendipita indica (strain DSM 11827) TaxID=1109443 RepID=G4TG39_SERID|nr:hypothetical protein PIIN_04209 [Serendipita indica DSM 11827]
MQLPTSLTTSLVVALVTSQALLANAAPLPAETTTGALATSSSSHPQVNIKIHGTGLVPTKRSILTERSPVPEPSFEQGPIQNVEKRFFLFDIAKGIVHGISSLIHRHQHH